MVSISEQETSSKQQDSYDPFDNIPDELTDLRQWVVFKFGKRKKNGKLDKIPYDSSTGRKAKTNDPQTWGTFTEAVDAYRKDKRGRWDGIGFVFAAGGGIFGIDLDGCRDPETGRLEPWAGEIVERIDSYTEVTPSSRGVHIIGKGTLPAGGRKKGNIEMYDSGRFFTMTGQHIGGTPVTLEDRTAELATLHPEVFGQQNGKPQEDGTGKARANGYDHSSGQGFLGSDEELVARAKGARNGQKFARLWGGDTTGYGSQSEAELALCSELAFWCGPDPARIDRLFRQSGLFRPKWDEIHFADGRTYGERTIEKALAGAQNFYTPGRGNGAAQAREKGILLDFNHTDLGNGERLVARHGENLHYCNPQKKWLVWDGERWKLDATQEVTRLARETLRAFYAEAAELAGLAASEEAEDEAVKFLSFARRSEAEPRVKAMVTFAQMDRPILPQDLDADPWRLNLSNGTLNLRTGELRPHRREDLITKLVSVAYDKAALCPRWEGFLARILPGREDVIAFLQRALGYSLTGDTSEQCLFLLHGTGANGKSTLLEIARALLGDYAEQAEFSTFLHKDRDTVRNDLAKLRGARFVSAVEVEEGRRLAEVVVKQLTGGDTITARFLFKEYFDFKPGFKLWLGANHKPVIRGTDHAIWRRIQLIPFAVTIPEEEQDRQLLAKLKAELPGILSWAVRGCLAWQRQGLDAPETVQAATTAYRAEMDLFSRFIDECCVEKEHAWAEASELYHAYRTWSGDKITTQTAFGLRLGERGFKRGRNTKNGRSIWCGIGLLEPQQQSQR